METTLKTQERKPVKKGSVAFQALFRLSLLLGPEALVVNALGHNRILCVLLCAVVLAIWLSVDVWPFRAASAEAPRPATPAPAHAYLQNMRKAQWWSSLFCKAALVLVAFHSKLTI